MVRHLRAEAGAGRMLPFVIEYQGRLVGQLTVAGITWGSMCSGHVGYWVDEAVAGRGVMPTAVALVVDHCFRTVGLHRIEVCIRPENRPSRRVVEKLGFREEGSGRVICTSTAPGATISSSRSPRKRCRRVARAVEAGTLPGDRRTEVSAPRASAPRVSKWKMCSEILIVSVSKNARNMSRIVRHTGPIGGWAHANPSTV